MMSDEQVKEIKQESTSPKVEAKLTEEDKKKEEELKIVEEYKLWRKNCRYMYDFISETALTWPSLSIQWLPSGTFVNKMKDTKYGTTRNILLTTHTSGEDTDYLKLSSMQLPKSIFPDGKKMSPEEMQTVNSRLKISKKYVQESEINRVRYMPQDPRCIATINGEGSCFVYSMDEKMGLESNTKLVHHKENGFGLCWNPKVKGELLTSSDDHTIALWNYEKPEKAPNETEIEIKPTKVFSYHNDIVNDVRWHNFSVNTFGSVSDDHIFAYMDKREQKPAILSRLNEQTSFNTLCFSKFSNYLFALGGEDSNVYLYDLRNTSRQLHVMMGHQKPITNVEWDPFHENVIASSSTDRRIILWDIHKIGEEQQPDEAEDGVPELIMMHGGHTGGVNDFQFSNEIPWCIASCSDDNIVHVWKVSRKVLEENGEKGYNIAIPDDLE